MKIKLGTLYCKRLC